MRPEESGAVMGGLYSYNHAGLGSLLIGMDLLGSVLWLEDFCGSGLSLHEQRLA